MWRTFWIFASIVGCILVTLVWGSTQVTFLFHHPRTAGVRVEVDQWKRAAIVVKPTAAKSDVHDSKLASNAKPCLETAETVFDFDTMSPHSSARHEFTIRNTGTAPLKLRVGSTTCKCTVSSVANNEVPPGESTTVALEWTTEDLSPFAQTATIHSNDPQHKSIDFVVKGKVRMRAGFDVPEILLDHVEPDQPTSVERLIYSQVWDTISITSVQSAMQDLKWEALVVNPAEFPELEAKSAVRLRITIPANAIQRRHEENLRLTVQSDRAETQDLHLPLSATALRRLAFYGPAIDEHGVIDLGNITEGQGKRVKLLVKVRDSEPDLTNLKLDVSPQFLVTTIRPHASKPGLYDLTIEVPDNAPVCQYRSTPIGRLRLETGHPRLGDVELKVSFTVVQRRSL